MARGSLYEGTTVARIADLSTLLFKGSVLELDRINLSEGMRVKYSIASVRDTLLSGTIISIAPMGIVTNGISRFEIVASIEIPPKRKASIYAGGTANAEVVVEERNGVLSLNEKYFQFDGDSIFVEISSEKGRSEKRYIVPGISDGINTEIICGLDINDSVIQTINVTK